jgi:hypothetical protein
MDWLEWYAGREFDLLLARRKGQITTAEFRLHKRFCLAVYRRGFRNDRRR